MSFQYMMVQIPPRIVVKQKEHRGNEAAFYLQSVANEHAQQGWEFFRVDTVGVISQPGCLASLFGASQMTLEYYVVTFRRQID